MVISPRHVSWTVILFALFVLRVQAQDAPGTRIDSIFANLNKPDVPGCAVAVYLDGNIDYASGYGSANLEWRVPITPSTVFDIGSLSKQFTAASVVMLAQEGKLDLNADIRRYLPEIPDYGTPITVQHLLHHTSGLRDYITLLLLAGHQMDDVTTPADALNILSRQKGLTFSPGSAYLYSNTGYFLLSLIVERVSGQSLREYARLHLFEPLGMTHTTYRDDHTELLPNRALAYAPSDKGYHLDVSNWEQLGDGAVFTTVEDLLIWDRNFYQPRVGGASLVETMETRGILTTGDTLGYAMGLMHSPYREFKTIQHSGSWGGYRSQMVRVPDKHLTVTLLCNVASAPIYPLANQVLDVYLGETAANAQASPSPEPAVGSAPADSASVLPVDALTGTFRNDDKGWILTFEHLADTLRVQTFGQKLTVRPAGVNTFDLVGGPMPAQYRFERDNEQRIRVVQILPYTTDSFRPFVRVIPSVDELAAYSGTYYSDELDTRYILKALDGRLAMDWFSGEQVGMDPMERDEFTRPGVRILFERTGDTITGMTVDAGSIKGLMFRKER